MNTLNKSRAGVDSPSCACQVGAGSSSTVQEALPGGEGAFLRLEEPDWAPHSIMETRWLSDLVFSIAQLYSETWNLLWCRDQKVLSKWHANSVGLGQKYLLKEMVKQPYLLLNADSPRYESSDSGCLVGLTDGPNAYWCPRTVWAHPCDAARCLQGLETASCAGQELGGQWFGHGSIETC